MRKPIMAFVLLVCLIMQTFSFSSYGVVELDKKSYFFAENGVMYKNCKKKIDNTVYTFDKNGVITNYQ